CLPYPKSYSTFFVVYRSGLLLRLSSFPTRRSSDLVLQLEDFSLYVYRDLLRQIAARHSRCYFCDVSYLRSQVRCHRIHVVGQVLDRKSTRLNSSHVNISYAVFCLKKKTEQQVSAIP